MKKCSYFFATGHVRHFVFHIEFRLFPSSSQQYAGLVTHLNLVCEIGPRECERAMARISRIYSGNRLILLPNLSDSLNSSSFHSSPNSKFCYYIHHFPILNHLTKNLFTASTKCDVRPNQPCVHRDPEHFISNKIVSRYPAVGKCF